MRPDPKGWTGAGPDKGTARQAAGRKLFLLSIPGGGYLWPAGCGLTQRVGRPCGLTQRVGRPQEQEPYPYQARHRPPPLRSRKLVDFQLWQEILRIMERKEHLTPPEPDPNPQRLTSTKP